MRGLRVAPAAYVFVLGPRLCRPRSPAALASGPMPQPPAPGFLFLERQPCLQLSGLSSPFPAYRTLGVRQLSFILSLCHLQPELARALLTSVLRTWWVSRGDRGDAHWEVGGPSPALSWVTPPRWLPLTWLSGSVRPQPVSLPVCSWQVSLSLFFPPISSWGRRWGVDQTSDFWCFCSSPMSHVKCDPKTLDWP